MKGDRAIGNADYRAPQMPMVRRDIEDKNSLSTSVPCGTCTLCCRTLIVPLADEEYKNYDWVNVHNAKTGEWLGRALKRRPDGSCVYLDERGCSIHGRAPHVCKRFDCRELFLKSDRAGRRQAVKSGKLPKALFDKGREMLKGVSAMSEEKKPEEPKEVEKEKPLDQKVKEVDKPTGGPATVVVPPG